MVNRISDAGEQKENFMERHNRHRVCQQGVPPAQPGTINIAAALDRLIADSQADRWPGNRVL